ncbi:uncharacterized protein LOC141700068 [Apium graveolens]|uniref:uncharacterized protein LOC141700068 n=1 Tax=Apium graveolens TaxID=4045 RepID=UPI003D79DDBA
MTSKGRAFRFNLEPNKRTQKELTGKKKKTAEKVLQYAEKYFNLKDMITEENLKKIGALSPRVGSLCKFRDFHNGKPILTASEKSKGLQATEIIQPDVNKKVDLEQDMASLPKGFAIGASKKLRARKQAPTKVDPKPKTPPPVATPSPPPKIIDTIVFDIPEEVEDAPSKRQKTVPDDQSFVLRYLGASSVGDFSEDEVRGWTFRTEQQTEEAMVKDAAELHLHARQSANMAARLRARLAVTDTANSQAEDKVKSLEKHIALLTQEKDAEIRCLEGERAHLETEKAVLEGNVSAMEKQMDSVIALNSTMQLELDTLNDDRLHGWTEEKKLVYQHGFQAGFEEWCSGFIANDPEYTFLKFDADTHIWVNDFRIRAAESIKNKRIFLGLEAEDASPDPAPLQTQPPPAEGQDKP